MFLFLFIYLDGSFLFTYKLYGADDLFTFQNVKNMSSCIMAILTAHQERDREASRIGTAMGQAGDQCDQQEGFNWISG